MIRYLIIFKFSCDELFLLSDPTAVSKTEGPSETKQATLNEKNEDSGSDYEEDWSGEEWNDAQVRTH